MLRPGEFLIHKGNCTDPRIVGHLDLHGPRAYGLVGRDFTKYPTGCMNGVPRATIAKIPRSEWPRLIAEIRNSGRLNSDVRLTGNHGGIIPSRDQNGRGYCWAHSTTSCAIMQRALENQPYEDLSAYAIACMIKNYRDEGGWNGESMEFCRTRGIPTSKTWAQQSVSRSNDNANTWAEASLYKMTEWIDIDEGDFDMQMTLLLMGLTHALDLNWWLHSIAAVDPVDGTSTWGFMRAQSGKLLTLPEFHLVWEVDEGGGFGIRIWNSWSDSYSDRGMAVLTESKATNNGAIALGVMELAA